MIDAVGLLAGAPTPRMYWADMKRRIQSKGFGEVSTKCRLLKSYDLEDAVGRTLAFRPTSDAH